MEVWPPSPGEPSSRESGGAASAPPVSRSRLRTGTSLRFRRTQVCKPCSLKLEVETNEPAGEFVRRIERPDVVILQIRVRSLEVLAWNDVERRFRGEKRK